MFEIGSSLREARERRGLELAKVEHETRIRSRYLSALEDERFDLIPGWVYAKGFLRTYADHLGLDADRFVDELVSRFPSEEEEEAPVPPPRPIARRRIRLPSSTVLAALGVAAAVAAAVIWVIGATGGSKHVASPPPPPPPINPPKVLTPPPAPKPALATLVLLAVRGRCWIEAHSGSRTGPQLYMSTLQQGQSLKLAKKQLWIRIGAPTALDATVNGKIVPLPSTTPVDVLVTPTGVQTVA